MGVIWIWPDFTCLRILENYFQNPDTPIVQTKIMRAWLGSEQSAILPRTLSLALLFYHDADSIFNGQPIWPAGSQPAGTLMHCASVRSPSSSHHVAVSSDPCCINKILKPYHAVPWAGMWPQRPMQTTEGSAVWCGLQQTAPEDFFTNKFDYFSRSPVLYKRSIWLIMSAAEIQQQVLLEQTHLILTKEKIL